MPPTELKLSFARNKVVEVTMTVAGAIGLGRQRESDEPLFKKLPVPERPWSSRIAIAPMNEVTVSRDHVLLEPLNDEKVRVSNVSSFNYVVVNDQPLPNRESREVLLPATVLLGERAVQIETAASSSISGLNTLMAQTVTPGARSGSRMPQGSVFRNLAGVRDTQLEAFIEWLQSVVGVLQSAAGSEDFYEQAVASMLDLVGLDTGAVFLLKRGTWERKSARSTKGPVRIDWRPSQTILASVLQEKRTVWQSGSPEQEASSLMGMSAVVAAPVLDRSGDVIGALYGDREVRGPTEGPLISPLQAQGVETLAMAVATGLARLEHEQQAVEARVRFEEYFTRELAEYLATDPDLLTGRDADISVLSCDIKGFSTICHRMGAEPTFRLVQDVMNALSECVRDEEGVIVDYVGDELMAMWGAPKPQSDHADRACRTAREMIARLPERTRHWEPQLGSPVQVRIGISSGPAWVGNTGSQWRFKYGPLGTPVNLASRVQGSTKFLHTDICLSEFTRSRLTKASDFALRRLGRVQVVNIPAPFELYELQAGHHTDDWSDLVERYEAALDLFETGHFSVAAKDLARILHQSTFDGPTLSLLARAVHFWEHPPQNFSPVWDLPGK